MTLRERSREEWTGGRTSTDIDSGSFQRIADAMEAMAQRHTDLIDEKERLRKFNNSLWKSIGMLERSNSALRGVITRMKRQANAE